MEVPEEQTEAINANSPMKTSFAEGFLLAGGFAAVVWTPEKLQKIEEAKRRRQEDKNRRQKPPKPPKRPNAGIGRLALGNT